MMQLTFLMNEEQFVVKNNNYSETVDSETAAAMDEQVAGSREAAGGGTDTTGKYRILADLKRVEQESKFLEKELEDLDTTENISTICEELLQFIESRPDPLLSVTNGPINPVWDRWFEGPQESQGCRCMIL